MGLIIVRTGTANLASIRAALRRAGEREPTITTDARTIENAERLILPGVGTFASIMSTLEQAGLIEILRARLRAARPTLCICLGMQILFDASEESPGIRGLSILPGQLQRFTAPSIRIPQLGWNTITAAGNTRFLSTGSVYFANSYRLPAPAPIPEPWRTATADHGGPFIAALERDNLLACQFHPELSGAFGLALIRRWLSATSTESLPPPAPAQQAQQESIPC